MRLEFQDLLEYATHNGPPGCVRATRLYEKRVDLSWCGRKWKVYLCNRRDGNHKFELRGAGEMTLSDMSRHIGEAVAIGSEHLKVMRIDLGINVDGYPVSYFRQGVRVKQRRHRSEYSRFVEEDKKIESLYFGARPNLLRIYDKTEQRRLEYRRLRSLWKRAEPVPTFEQLYGQREDAILTRVERQYGKRVPQSIGTLGQIKQNATRFNPFEAVEFRSFAISNESVDRLSGDEFIRAYGVISLINEFGFHEAKRLLDKKACRNSARIFRQLENSLGSVCLTTVPDLYGLYKDALSRQLTA